MMKNVFQMVELMVDNHQIMAMVRWLLFEQAQME
ncbi:hypothetical protein HID58_068196 [Brassica napus]|uniref:Uncharacterized protein n=1 Tax=Brassica napus TaxID=3708 RepID=A0ABQ7ZKL6_BRANA|nr:hypothetical protein HID58_068196 [Brassica napus]